MGKEKLNIIDVGCGQFLDEVWIENNKLVNFYIGFDPDDNVKVAQKTFPNGVIYNTAIFDEEGSRPFYICNKPQCSSLFPPNMDVVREYVKKDKNNYEKYHRVDVKEIKDIECTRLDTILSNLEVDFDFLKMDSQGSDYNILKSLGEYLKTQIVGVQTEVFFESMYEGIHLYKDIKKLLKSNGFKLVKKITSPSKWHGEYLYIREDISKKDKIRLIKKIYKN